ncbi:MAG TPA: ABC transporter permease [Solirubrobacteraceae bacterium]|jgi:peptide/nickel transport system permease protein|nr:ABC transporter permease [Solirubrobacteraceae bacterium]
MSQAARQEIVLAGARALRRQVDRQNRWADLTLWAGAGILAVLVLAAVFASVIAPYQPDTQHLTEGFLHPSGAHLFGTDAFGRDIFSRALYGLRVDLLLGIIATYVPLVVGMALGAVAGYYRGWPETVIMRLTDVTIALPFIVLILAIVAIVGPGLTGVYIGEIAVSWALYARLTRAEMLVLREKQFIVAAQALGYSTPRILFKHALPHLVRPNLVFSMADIVLNILVLASLSFLGVGVQPPTPELGAMIAEGGQYLLSAWWIATLPGLVLVLLGSGFSLIGDALADRFGQRLELPR